MSVILQTYQMAQLTFDNLSLGEPQGATKEDITQYRRKISSLKHDFVGNFDRSVALLKKQKQRVLTDADQDAVRHQVAYLAKITTLFASRLPTSYYNSVYEIEHFLKADIFNDEQRGQMCLSFKKRLQADIKENLKVVRYFFVNDHNFEDAPHATGILNDILINNFADMCRVDRDLSLYYAVKISPYFPEEAKHKLVAVIPIAPEELALSSC